EKRARRLEDLARALQLRHLLAPGPTLLTLRARRARLLPRSNARPMQPAAPGVERSARQPKRASERGPHGLLRSLLPPLVEHPDDPVLRLQVVLGPHASFSPFAWKESLYQSQYVSSSQRS